MNREGEYEGFSANYSGAGFSDMRFRFHGLTAADFDQWVARARASGRRLDRARYLQLERPSEREPVQRFGSVSEGLYEGVVDRTVLNPLTVAAGGNEPNNGAR
jgi:cytochrome o ubiquinol oxidase subunit 2